MCVFYALVCCVAAWLIVLIMYSRIVNVGNERLPIWLHRVSDSLLGLFSCAMTVSDLLTDVLCQQHRCAAWTLQFVCLLQSLACTSFMWVHDWTVKCSDWLQCEVWVSNVSSTAMVMQPHVCASCASVQFRCSFLHLLVTFQLKFLPQQLLDLLIPLTSHIWRLTSNWSLPQLQSGDWKLSGCWVDHN